MWILKKKLLFFSVSVQTVPFSKAVDQIQTFKIHSFIFTFWDISVGSKCQKNTTFNPEPFVYRWRRNTKGGSCFTGTVGQDFVYIGSVEWKRDGWQKDESIPWASLTMVAERLPWNLTFVSKMLVGYSSSSEEENDAVTGAPDNVKSPAEEDAQDSCSARKKPRTEDKVPKTRCIICFVGIV